MSIFLSSSANGNGTTPAGFSKDENASVVSAPTLAKEAKVKASSKNILRFFLYCFYVLAFKKNTFLCFILKEIVQNVVGLASEEEERRGVAASLLGPLIPSEIKEAEEKWRKRLLTGIDEPGNSVDSDGDGVLPAGSPAPPPPDADSAQNVQRDVSVKKQPAESTEGEEETEEDTVELELALERKKVCVEVRGGVAEEDFLQLLLIMSQQPLNFPFYRDPLSSLVWLSLVSG